MARCVSFAVPKAVERKQQNIFFSFLTREDLMSLLLSLAFVHLFVSFFFVALLLLLSVCLFFDI